MKTRRLSDLYIVGREVTFDDGLGEPITVYLRKLNSIQTETALREANRKRAVFLSAIKDEGSIDYKEFEYAHAPQLRDRQVMTNLLVDDALAEVRVSASAEIAAEEEWSKDGYLQGLFDARNAEDVSDTVTSEIARYEAEVQDRVDVARRDQEQYFESLTDDAIESKYFDKMVEREAGIRWLVEFRMCEIWMSTRVDKDSKQSYFESRDEVDNLDAKVLRRLIDEYSELTVEPQEGKDLRQTQDSSPSSEPPSTEETIPSSGPLVAIS